MFRVIFVGIPLLALAFTLSHFSNICVWKLGTRPVALEKLYCEILLRIHWYVSFGLDEFVADIIWGSPDRHETALINVLHSKSKEFSGLAFSTLLMYFDNDKTRQVLERFVENLDSEDTQSKYRKRMKRKYSKS